MELFIGIETEGFWKVKKGLDLGPVPADTESFARALTVRYNINAGKNGLRADFSHGSHPGHYESASDKEEWIVATDSAIGGEMLDGSKSVEGHPLEFVSPILFFGLNSRWRKEVRRHWTTLLKIGEVEVDDMCATHVHISPLGSWGLEQLKQVAKAIVYFENAFKVISAPSRRSHDFTNINKGDIERIQSCTSNLELIKEMQPGDSNTAPPIRDYAWNFMNTDEKFAQSGQKPIGTIEFRRAPGVMTAEHCLIWVELAVTFVQAAAQYDAKRVLEEDYDPSVKDLKRFILSAKVADMNEEDLLNIVFYPHLDNKQPVATDEQLRDVFDERIKELRRLKPESWRPWAQSSS